MPFFYALAVLGAVVGGFTLLTGMVLTKSAPQEAAAAAMAVGFAVVPYVLMRVVQLNAQDKMQRQANADLAEQMERLIAAQKGGASAGGTAAPSAPAEPPAKPFKAGSVWNGLG